ncbi:MAG TPA: phosphoenolpyruvate carboxykinase (ATP) [Methylocella sp.]|jgi:phosphoenolpyruvate carboxykinase (ATP)|nr:phosphoenolpyruvate carboxykinase (ATP) [Methylocella sp.]
MNRAGPVNPAFGVESFGLKDLKSISYNLQAPRLVEDAIRRGEAMVAKGSALSAETGVHTGRSPNDEFAVPDALTDKTVWWDNNKAMTPQAFDTLYADMLAHANGMKLYAQGHYGGAWSAPTDGSGLYICALTASRLAWAA